MEWRDESICLPVDLLDRGFFGNDQENGKRCASDIQLRFDLSLAMIRLDSSIVNWFISKFTCTNYTVEKTKIELIRFEMSTMFVDRRIRRLERGKE